VVGQAQVRGILDVCLTDGFAPAFGSEFALLTCSLGCNGAFNRLEFLPSENDYETISAPNSVRVHWVGESATEHLVFLPLITR
jgi:hypothetical protein